MLKKKRAPAVFSFAALAAYLLLLCSVNAEARRTVYVPGDYPTIQDVFNALNLNSDVLPDIIDNDPWLGARRIPAQRNRGFDDGRWDDEDNRWERMWVPVPYDTLVIRLGYEHDVQEYFIHTEDTINFAPLLYYEEPEVFGTFTPTGDPDDEERVNRTRTSKNNKTLIIKGSPTRGATIRGGGDFLLNVNWTSGGSGHTLILENIVFEGAPGANLQDGIRNSGGSVEIRNCEFRNMAGDALRLHGSSSDISNVTIQDVGTGIYSNRRLNFNYSTITGAADFGIYRDGQDTDIYQSEISNSGMAVYITGPDLFDPNHHSIEYSILENNEFGLFISTDIWEPTFSIRNNSFAGNTEYGLFNQAWRFEINASENYWGDEGGPSGAGDGAGAAVSDYVNFAPWYVNPEMTVLSDGTPPAPPPEPRPRPADTSEAPRPSGDCFIATASFGSYESREVKAFRNFRDLFLLESEPGRKLVNSYYRLSPAAAEIIAGNRLLRIAARLHLMPASTALMFINR